MRMHSIGLIAFSLVVYFFHYLLNKTSLGEYVRNSLVYKSIGDWPRKAISCLFCWSFHSTLISWVFMYIPFYWVFCVPVINLVIDNLTE